MDHQLDSSKMSVYESFGTGYPSHISPPRQRKEVEPLSQDEITYAQAMTALEISTHFISRSLMMLRTSNSDHKALEREKADFKAKVDSVVATFATQPPEGETPRSVAETLAKAVDGFQVARGIRFDLAGGDRKALSKISREKQAFVAWKEEEDQKDVKDRRDRPAKNKGNPAYRGYETEINIVKPRLQNIVGGMTKGLERLWNYEYEDDVSEEDVIIDTGM